MNMAIIRSVLMQSSPMSSWVSESSDKTLIMRRFSRLPSLQLEPLWSRTNML